METQAARTIEANRGTGVGFEPETILPSQYFDRFQIDASLQPEKRLMIAILKDALLVVRRYQAAEGPWAQRQLREAEEWFASHDTSWPFAFERICEELALDPDHVRAGVRRLLHGRQLVRLQAARRRLMCELGRVRAAYLETHPG